MVLQSSIVLPQTKIELVMIYLYSQPLEGSALILRMGIQIPSAELFSLVSHKLDHFPLYFIVG